MRTFEAYNSQRLGAGTAHAFEPYVRGQYRVPRCICGWVGLPTYDADVALDDYPAHIPVDHGSTGCPACGGVELVELGQLGRIHWGRCRACGIDVAA